jgi:hypothetical protein
MAGGISRGRVPAQYRGRQAQKAAETLLAALEVRVLVLRSPTKAATAQAEEQNPSPLVSEMTSPPR